MMYFFNNLVCNYCTVYANNRLTLTLFIKNKVMSFNRYFSINDSKLVNQNKYLCVLSKYLLWKILESIGAQKPHFT